MVGKTPFDCSRKYFTHAISADPSKLHKIEHYFKSWYLLFVFYSKIHLDQDYLESSSGFIHFPSHIQPITIPCRLLGPSSIILAFKIKASRLINFCGKMMNYLKFQRIICPTFICTLFSCLDSLLTELISDLVCKLIKSKYTQKCNKKT